MTMSVPTLSVVVIARNEEHEIGRCLASVVRAASGFDAEILFVDSASSDRTVDVARGYPVGIISCKDNGFLSPAAGRWVGSQQTSGEYLFFVDGDMTIVDGWIGKAMEVLSDPRIGGVSGRLYWVYPGETESLSRPDTLPLGIVRGLGGAAVYRRKALKECGSFNPFVRGEEERELAYRLLCGGYSVVRVDTPMAYHYAKKPSMEENAGRSVYFAGVGQTIRSYPFRQPFWDLLAEHRRVYAVWLLGAAIPLILAALLLKGAFGPAAGVVGLTVAGFVLLVLRKGLHGAWLYLHSHTLLLWHFLRGLRRGIPAAESFPCEYAWVKPRGIPTATPSNVKGG